ncbi:BTAD domain-containing putative transcriptional regulator [Pseudonocardia sp. CA-107938]|uniref:BTAD domain-containing putative transcriptional regulator n=1 Tax=Pseudonocardia sp. CA-107938 TaxID=3240021 RepID=UPI003D92E8A4
MRIGLLGAVEATTGDGRAVPLGGLRLRGLLARLALDAGRPVPSSTLVDDLWGGAPPEDAANALQALVSRLRRAVGAEHVVTDARGYRLALSPDAVDVGRFVQLTGNGSLDQVREGLALWRGPALADIAELPFAEAAAARLTDRRAGAVEHAATLALERGDGAGEIERLTAQLDAAPLRETTAALLARCLHAAGRQADALAVLDRTRHLLVEQLGVDPGPEWAAARLAVLRDERPPGPVRPPQLPLTSFVGRERDVERLRALLPSTRLVTLIGPGGAGKTRLAVQLAAESGGRVAELAALGAPEQLPAALLSAVGNAEIALRGQDDPGTDLTSRLVTLLAGRDLLLVVDNCEHLVDGVAQLVAMLLAAAPRLRVLATSREPLGVPGEVLHPVSALADDDAVRLFADRAAAASPAFALTPDVEKAVREICRRLDGQPLPIELAAARTRSLSPAEIAARLDDRFRLLTSGARTALPRHQTLRAVVDWSWDLLGEPERAVARRLAAFAGSAGAAAVDRVCSAPGGVAAEDVFELLASLVDRSLVVAVPQPDGTTRYRMLETIRVYAAEKLAESGEEAAARAAHAAYVVELVEAAEPHLRGRDQLTWIERLQAEADEIVVALDRAIAAADTATAHRIVAGMGTWWIVRGMIDDAARWVDAAAQLDGPAPPEAQALTLTLAGLSDMGRSDLTSAKKTFQRALGIVEELPRPWHPMIALLGPAYAYYADEDPEPLRRLVEETDDTWLRGMALLAMVQTAENEGRLDEQVQLLRRAHTAFREIGERFGLGMTLHSLAELEDLAGNHEAAARTYEEAIALATELGNIDDLPQFTVRRAMLEARRGNPVVARDQIRAVVAEYGSCGDITGRSAQIALLAEAERRAGDIPAARAAIEKVRAQVLDTPAVAPQVQALMGVAELGIALAVADLPGAADALRAALVGVEAAPDGPIAALVAGAAARLALATGDAQAAATAIGVSVRRRGAPDLGDVETVATHTAVVAALGEQTEAAIDAGRALDIPDGLAVLRAIADSAGPAT